MDKKQWKARYYPVSAEKVPKSKALEHSIQKWIGLLMYGNVAKLHIDSSTCALCRHYIRNQCTGCPLYESRGRVRCDWRTASEVGSPYTEWDGRGDAGPMVLALLKAKEWARKKGRR